MLVPPVLALLAACGGSATHQARELSQNATSWEATGRLTIKLLRRGAVPGRYAMQTLKVVSRELAKTRQGAQKLSP